MVGVGSSQNGCNAARTQREAFMARFPIFSCLHPPEAVLVLVATIVTGKRGTRWSSSSRAASMFTCGFLELLVENVSLPERCSRRWGSAGSMFHQNRMDIFGHLLFLPSNANRNVNLRSSSNSRPLRHDGDDTAVMIEGSAEQLDTDRGERITSHGSRLRRRISPDVPRPRVLSRLAGVGVGSDELRHAACWRIIQEGGGRGGGAPKTTASCAFAGSTASFDCGPTRCSCSRTRSSDGRTGSVPT
jgi:hypothetical protein